MGNNKRHIYVDAEFADKFEALEKETNTIDQQEKVWNEYFDKLNNDVKREFSSSLESLEENAAMFTGLMIKVKQTFGKAADEHLNSSYEVWENYDKELPNIRDKTQKMIDVLNPLKNELTEINTLIGKINIWDIEKLIKTISLLSEMYGTNKEMVEFLVNNFKK
jgi:chromosome condensin MukBEF ATPase and DNA-binding subunit MukB